MKWPFSIRQRHEEKYDTLQSAFPNIEKIGENLTPNMRALRLAMTVGDTMLSMGVPASRVTSRMLDVTEAYCKSPVHIDVSASTMMLSQLRGIDKEPLTLIRPVVPHDINNMTLQLIQQLIYDIKGGKVSLEKAENRVEEILKNPITYPAWMVTSGNALIAAGVSIMFSPRWQIWVTTFVIAVMIERLIGMMSSRGLTPFFRQICAAAFATLAAACINQLTEAGVGFFANLQPTLIVVGGIVMLLAGLLFVGAIQDAIEEYYVTANARISKVILMTLGIVIGVTAGLYIARKMGIGIYVSPNPLVLNTVGHQIFGGALAAAGFALGTQTRMRAILWAGIMGAATLEVLFITLHVGLSPVAASGVAAVFTGLVATLFSIRWKTPTSGIIAAGILPLVPGLALFNGLMQLANYPPGDPSFQTGVSTLFSAFATALAIAVGATLGNILGHPLHHQATQKRNTLPFSIFIRDQFRYRRQHSFNAFGLIKHFEHLWHKNNSDNESREEN